MNYKAGFVALVGVPNAGKSTLLNCLVGEKVSIVTRKAQTTRRRVTGIWSTENFQGIFVDTPGWIQDESGLNKFLCDELQDVTGKSDALLLILNPDVKNPEAIDKLIDVANKSHKPWSAVITKKDIGKAHRVDIIRSKVQDQGKECVEVCAVHRREETRERVAGLLYDLLPESPAPLYDTDIFTTEKVRDLAAEYIREECFDRLHQEIPYQSAVLIRSYEEFDNLVKIYADIVIDKDNHKRIVIGQGAKTLKSIGQNARIKLEKVVGKKIYLELHVAVKNKWMKNNQLMKELGYVVGKN